MKELIKEALQAAVYDINKKIPTTKKDIVFVNLDDKNIRPVDLPKFMVDNGIPETAYLATKEEFHGLGSSFDVFLAYEVFIPTTKEDRILAHKRKFSADSFRYIYDVFTQNGYKRIGVSSAKLKGYDKYSAYTMWINEDYEGLFSFYSLFFEKIT